MSQYDMNDLQHGHAAFANAGALAWSVYDEDRDLYERTLANICADADPSYKEAEFSWLRKPVNTGTGGALAYNINPVTGQNKESDRDMKLPNGVQTDMLQHRLQLKWLQLQKATLKYAHRVKTVQVTDR